MAAEPKTLSSVGSATYEKSKYKQLAAYFTDYETHKPFKKQV